MRSQPPLRFHVGDAEFDAILARVKRAGLAYGSAPGVLPTASSTTGRRARRLFQGPGWSHTRAHDRAAVRTARAHGGAVLHHRPLDPSNRRLRRCAAKRRREFVADDHTMMLIVPCERSVSCARSTFRSAILKLRRDGQACTGIACKCADPLHAAAMDEEVGRGADGGAIGRGDADIGDEAARL